MREAAIRFALLLGGAVVALTAMEMGLRLLPSAQRYHVWPPLTVRSWPPRPDVFPGIEGPAIFTINSEGMRARELGPDGAEYRLLAIGGSTTEAIHVADNAAWTALLEQQLGNTRDGRTTWVGNVGRSGMNSRDHLLHVEILTQQYPSIDTLLVLAGINDLTVALAQPQTPSPPITDPVVRPRLIDRAFAVAPGQYRDYTVDDSALPFWSFYKNTALWRLLRRARRGLELRSDYRALGQDPLGDNLELWRQRRRAATVVREQLPDLSAALASYRTNLQAIAEISRAQRRRLVLLTQPTIWRAGLSPEIAARCWLGGVGDFQRQQSAAYYSLEALSEAMTRFNDVLIEVGREQDVEVIDLAAEIPKDESMFFDDAHFSEAGERMVATVIAKHLKRRGPYATSP